MNPTQELAAPTSAPKDGSLRARPSRAWLRAAVVLVLVGSFAALANVGGKRFHELFPPGLVATESASFGRVVCVLSGPDGGAVAAIAQPYAEYGRGGIVLVDLASGELVETIDGEQLPGWPRLLGARMHDVGDADGDGHGDLLAFYLDRADPGDASDTSGGGAALFSGRSGELIHVTDGLVSLNMYASASTRGGRLLDFDGDGVGDFSAKPIEEGGRVALFSGATGVRLPGMLTERAVEAEEWRVARLDGLPAVLSLRQGYAGEASRLRVDRFGAGSQQARPDELALGSAKAKVRRFWNFPDALGGVFVTSRESQHAWKQAGFPLGYRYGVGAGESPARFEAPEELRGYGQSLGVKAVHVFDAGALGEVVVFGVQTSTFSSAVCAYTLETQELLWCTQGFPSSSAYLGSFMTNAQLDAEPVVVAAGDKLLAGSGRRVLVLRAVDGVEVGRFDHEDYVTLRN